jgi:hypothetical protein
MATTWLLHLDHPPLIQIVATAHAWLGTQISRHSKKSGVMVEGLDSLYV